MGGSQPWEEMGRGLLGGGDPVVTHIPKLDGLWGFGRGASSEVPRPGVDLSSSLRLLFWAGHGQGPEAWRGVSGRERVGQGSREHAGGRETFSWTFGAGPVWVPLVGV